VPPIIDCTIYPVTVETMCKNPADNIGGGVVFDLRDKAFSGEGYVLAEDLNAKGQYDSYIGFTNETLFDAFGYGTTDDICDEFNGSGNEQSAWSLVPEAEGGYIHILKLFMAFRAYVDIDGDGFIDVTPVEDVHLACRAPEGANFDEPGDYYCTELCDKTKKTDCTEDPYTYLDDPNFTFFD
jgi:hypothetical protein